MVITVAMAVYERRKLRALNAAAAAVKIEGDRLPKPALDMTGVEAPPKR
jgi:hypothetical protein